MNRYDLSTNKAFCHILGSMEDMRYNDAGKLDKAKTSHVPGQNPGPDMQVLTSELMAGECLKGGYEQLGI